MQLEPTFHAIPQTTRTPVRFSRAIDNIKYRKPALSQVPQMILEEAWEDGRGARIMCTQPRRISAVSVAERIAQERGEKIGDSVGYTIRLESK